MHALTLESCLVAALGNLVLGAAVLLRRPSSRTHQAFAALSLAIALWNAADFAYLLSGPTEESRSLLWHRLLFTGSMLIPPAAFWLVRSLTGRGRDWTWRYSWVLSA